jgi:curved DNA binding protein
MSAEEATAAVAAVEVDAQEKEADDCTNPKVVTKYRTAGEIVNDALKHIKTLCVAGASIIDVCTAGDAYIVQRTDAIYKSDKKMTKGIGFPVCVSVNHIVGHYSPLADANKNQVLQDKDLVKIDLGVHIDGYVAVGACTVYLNGGAAIEGEVANLMKACDTAAKLAVRMLTEGGTNTAITDMFGKVSAAFGVNMVQGVLSHELARHSIDGAKCILSKEDKDQKVDEVKFNTNEVYALDIVMCTGEGKPKESEERTTVYKRNQDTTYKLKMKGSREVFSEIGKKFPTFPFSIRSVSEQGKVRFGIVECQTHGLVAPYPVLVEQKGTLVCHVKLTAAILANGTVQICGIPLVQDMSSLKTDKALTDEPLLAILKAGGKKKKRGKKKKTAAAAAE